MADKLYIRGKRKKSNTKNQGIKRVLIIFTIIIFSLVSGATIAIFSISSALPDVNQIKDYSPNQTSQIYDSNNHLLGKIYDEENRVVIPINQIPKNVQNAVISMEDERFYSHSGVDSKAVFRSVISFIPGLHLVRGGGSTLTQQLARNLFLTRDMKISRKIAELFMARKIENVLTKEQILQLYLNEVYWGHNAYGVESASRVFFGKSVKNLNLAESSMLGGLLSSPEYYSPYKSLERAKWRQSLTLQNMVKNKYITQQESDNAKKTKIYLVGLKKSYKISYPYFTSYVISLLRSKYDDNTLKTGGLKIYTTVDSEAQEHAEKTLEESIGRLKRLNITQGALVSVDPNNGYIRSLVGGVNYSTSEFNRITQAKRQPGSSFKPIVYLTAFSKKLLTPYSQVVDEAVSYSQPGLNWNPKNFDGRFHGSMTVMEAIKHSINTIAIKTLDMVGIKAVIATATKLGITSKLSNNLSLALGSSEVTPLEMARAYSVFATGGKKVNELTPILKIVDKNGNILEDNTQYVSTTEVFDHVSIDMVNESLKSVVSVGGSGAAAIMSGREIAGKTGTTSDSKDSWFIGYTPQLVTLVWVGNDNNSKMLGATGGGICAPIWKKYMQVVLQKYPNKKFATYGNWRYLATHQEEVKAPIVAPTDISPSLVSPEPTPTDSGITFEEQKNLEQNEEDNTPTQQDSVPSVENTEIPSQEETGN
ncbi:MAG: PBP1A family penicillin-binding protein [Candidatus Sericytochromatia bacterium]|nr:PBP1A family penicillin-binding protein [Candidatus Sericytochromatia bacterium]